MGTLFDVAGAVIIRATIVGIILTVTVTLNDTLYYKTAVKNVQAELSSVVEVVEADFRKIGYNSGLGSPFIMTGPENIKFLADIDNSLGADTVSYFLGSTTDSLISMTPNPEDRLLYRRIDGSIQELDRMTGVVTGFRLSYYKVDGDTTSDPLLIGSLLIQIEMQHGYFTYGNRYPLANWERQMFPTNL